MSDIEITIGLTISLIGCFVFKIVGYKNEIINQNKEDETNDR